MHAEAGEKDKFIILLQEEINYDTEIGFHHPGDR